MSDRPLGDLPRSVDAVPRTVVLTRALTRMGAGAATIAICTLALVVSAAHGLLAAQPAGGGRAGGAATQAVSPRREARACAPASPGAPARRPAVSAARCPASPPPAERGSGVKRTAARVSPE